jgi:aspartyl-tRNA(Asn)/glutamyl-tRNA(Gln) amidotransferase subunit A
MTGINFLTIAEASRLLARRQLSPVELTDACIGRLEQVNGRLNSVVTPTLDRARLEAKAAQEEIVRGRYRGPLHGIPYGLKDVFETAGIRTTAQSRLLADYVPSSDCDAQARLAAAGGILLGKTATWEFALGGPSWDILFPPTRNPWNLDHDPAGSSSGSAASVAAGICLAAMGTDTGGSIRLPAAACGVAGLKPTYGRLSRRGILPNAFTHDHSGPLAWCVEDLAILLQILAGHDYRDVSSADLPVPDYRGRLDGDIDGIRIGVPYRWIEEEAVASVEVRQALDASLGVLQGMGVQVRPVELPPLLQFEDVKRTIALAELFSIHEATLRTRPEIFGANLRFRIIAGALVRAEDYVQALRMRADLARAVQNIFDEIDLIILPTAEPAGRLEATHPGTFFTHVGWTTAFNVSGNPSLSICNGFSSSGLPLSLQIVGNLFDEATVLKAGHAFELATEWRDRRPIIESVNDGSRIHESERQPNGTPDPHPHGA